ncbi:MAG: hypothetical protein D3906_03905 [Candidatus Electrothrix sp. AUS1_2]|nr:hypothetical protein [Candidatus Electrothrix sp. AUS1_2]
MIGFFIFAIAVGALSKIAVNQKKQEREHVKYTTPKKEEKQSQEPETEKIYSWRDENGKWHYSNVAREEQISGKYKNNYRGIYTGISTVNDVYREMGQPISIEPAGKGKNYRYKKIIVNFPGSPNPKVNTIIIEKDYEYTDENGFGIGTDIEKIRNKLGRGKNSTISDKKHGIIYWHDGKKVKKIVLTKSLTV